MLVPTCEKLRAEKWPVLAVDKLTDIVGNWLVLFAGETPPMIIVLYRSPLTDVR